MIDSQPTVRGGLELTFRPEGRFRSATVLTIFALLLLGGLAWLARPFSLEGFLLGLFHFGVFPAGLALIALKFWLGKERVTIESGTVTIQSSVLGLGKTRRIPCREVIAVKASGTGTSYEIHVVVNDGRKWPAATSIRTQNDAVSAADAMMRAITVGR
jgi:hypothetical protein